MKHVTDRPARAAGILLHVTSLPGPYGVGDLGPAAFAWVDLLARAGQRWWQTLPLGPPGEGHSPYRCYSAFAGNPDLISPDKLVQSGLLAADDLPATPLPPGRADYPRASARKARLIDLAWERFRNRRQGGQRGLAHAFESFCEHNLAWLDDFALFMALKRNTAGRDWAAWPKAIVRRRPAALADARDELRDAVDRVRFAQFLFFRQLDDLRRYARAKNVRLIGDLPIFVSPESADVWANPHLFRLDRRTRRPTVVAGVPPDYFSATGQRWGNPLYDWRAIRRDHFQWWLDRFRATLRQADLVRIDHFRGFAACWEIPAGRPDAVRGRWAKSPGAELFAAARKALGDLPFIAEDLGLITPDVHALRRHTGLPGMRVLQFAFGDRPDNPFLPHNYDGPRTVCYTGTHDNDTTVGWYRGLRKSERDRVGRYAPGAAARPARALLRLAWSSIAELAIAPAQDVLELGRESRMNVPGKAAGNWRWRLGAMPAETATGRDAFARLGDLTRQYARSS
jgi:4-alpha-glucanotransferase